MLNEADRGISSGVDSGVSCDQSGRSDKSPMWKGASWYRYRIINNLDNKCQTRDWEESCKK